MPRYVRLPRELARYYGRRWDDISFKELPLIGVAIVRVQCIGIRPWVPETAPPWHRECRHQVDVPIEMLIGASPDQDVNDIRRVLRCRVCGSDYPRFTPLRLAGDQSAEIHALAHPELPDPPKPKVEFDPWPPIEAVAAELRRQAAKLPRDMQHVDKTARLVGALCDRWGIGPSAALHYVRQLPWST